MSTRRNVVASYALVDLALKTRRSVEAVTPPAVAQNSRLGIVSRWWC
jgi:hypothetical protein